MYNMKNELGFSDCIEFLTNKYEVIMYNLAYSKALGFYLINEETNKPIKEILLIDSKLTIRYLDGEVKELDNIVLSVTTEIKKRMKNIVLGYLFQYDKEDAMSYNLDITKAIDSEIERPLVKKRVLPDTKKM